MGAVQKYLNPITLEAKLFAESLATLSVSYGALDVQLVEALENVMTAIEKFIDSNANNEIVDTSNTKLHKCNGLEHIQRTYRCLCCKKDLGRTITKVAVHLADDCIATQEPVARSVSQEAQKIPKTTNNKAEKIVTTAESKRSKKNDKGPRTLQRLNRAVKINKKTKSFLLMDHVNLSNFLTDFVQIGEKLKNLPDYKTIENDIMALLQPQYPDQVIKMYIFGSRMTGIGTRESDLDIFVDLGERYRKFEHRPSKESLAPLYMLHKAMLLHRKTWKGMVLVDSARVPILRILHTQSGIECDINVTNSLGHINTQLLEYIFSLQPLAQCMCIYMKKWLARTNQKCDFSTYSLTLMVIFYLQQNNFLPPISKFFENVNKDSALTVGPWLSSFTRLTLKDLGLPKASVSKLIENVKGFFRYFYQFDYKNQVICPHVGKAFKKSALFSAMPESYISYINDKKDADIALNKPMVVQDPIELNNNVTKGLSEFGLNVFKEYMLISLQFVEERNESQ